MNADPSESNRFQRILFCTDFSASADYAFEFALEATVSRPGAELYLLHVIPEADAQFWQSYLYEIEHLDDQARQDIDAKIAAAYLGRVPAGLAVNVELRVGSEAGKILEVAEELNIDLIVIGREGHTGMERALFGKVVEKVAGKAQCPVMVVPLRARQQPQTK